MNGPVKCLNDNFISLLTNHINQKLVQVSFFLSNLLLCQAVKWYSCCHCRFYVNGKSKLYYLIQNV